MCGKGLALAIPSSREQNNGISVTTELAEYLHNVRTAFAVYQGNTYLQKQGAVPASARRKAARRLIETLQQTERLGKKR